MQKYLTNAERIELILNVTTEGFWDWDLKTDRAYLSPRYCELTGYAPDDTVFDSQFLKKITHPDDHEHIFKVIGEHLQGKRQDSIIQYRMISKDGTMRWIEGRGKVVEYDEQGMPARMVGTIVDITERKLAHERVFDIVSNLPELLVSRFDSEFRHQYVSPSIEKTTGLPQEHFIGKSNRDLGFPEDLVVLWEEALKQVFATAQPHRIEFGYSSPDGPKFYSSFMVPEPSRDGTISSVACFVRDITERKQADEELCLQSKIITNMTEGVNLVRADNGIILYTNQRFEQMFGYDPGELIGKKISIVNAPNASTPDETMKAILEILNESGEWHGEIENVKKDGTSFWCYANVSAFDHPRYGRVMVAIHTDITQRKEAESERDRLKVLIRTMIDSCPAWIACTDPAGTYLIANKYYSETFNIPLSQIEGHNFQSFFPPDLYAKHKQLIDQCIASNQTLHWEDQAIFPNDRLVYLYGSYTPLHGNDGSLWGISAFALDVSPLKLAEKEKDRLQSQIQQAAKMQAVGTLAGGIAHEFNNLLSVVIGCTEMALDEVPVDSFAKSQLNNVIKASFRLKDLVKQILTFSRQGQQTRIPANLCPLVKESLKLIQSAIPSSVEIHSNIDSGCHNTKVDPTEIQQIVMNLCSNAVWAMKEKGTITISLHEVSLRNEDEVVLKGLSAGDYIKLSFADTGCGMGPQTVSQIFVPFFTTKEVGQGTGMGLSIIYAIMESSGGTITVESEVGKGTTFHLYFPVTDEAPSELQTPVEGIPKGKERILLVDDEPLYAEMEAEVVRRLGYDVCLKTNSIEALKAFEAAPENYDLVITDQIMPGLSGEELVTKIRKIQPKVPIILCTGYSLQMDEQKAKALDINGFVFKPIGKKEIATLIRKVLDT